VRTVVTLLVAICGIATCLNAQQSATQDNYSFIDSARLTDLKTQFGKYKKVPSDFEAQFFEAISYFPELRNARIRVKVKKGNSGIISTRPTWTGLFRRSSKRSYIVIIGDSAGTRMPRFMYRHSPFDGQVGIMGHELVHILNFSRMNTFQLLGVGAAHVSTRYMDRFENKTDSVTIVRGLGEQLIVWNVYLRRAFGIPDDGPDPFFSKTGRERYMSPARIREVMNRSGKNR
jgi:hypothetical protein